MSTAVETPKSKAIWWGVNAIVLLYAFIPVIWIISLSLKPDATLNDGRFLPARSRASTTRRSSRTTASPGP